METHRAFLQFLLRQRDPHRRKAARRIGSLDRLQRALHVGKIFVLADERRDRHIDLGPGQQGRTFQHVAADVEAQLGRFGYRPRSRIGSRRLGSCGNFAARLRGITLQGNQQAVAVDLGVIRQHLVEINHQARAPARLDNIGATQARHVEILHRPAQPVSGIQEIQHDTRRGIGGVEGKPCGQIGQRLRQFNLDDRLSAADILSLQRGNAVLRIHPACDRHQRGKNPSC